MTIQPGKCAIALAVSVALLWIICSALVWLTPAMMMSMTESMLHADLAHVNWKMAVRSTSRQVLSRVSAAIAKSYNGVRSA